MSKYIFKYIFRYTYICMNIYINLYLYLYISDLETTNQIYTTQRSSDGNSISFTLKTFT